MDTKLMGTYVYSREKLFVVGLNDEDGHDNDTFPHSTNTFFDLIYT